MAPTRREIDATPRSDYEHWNEDRDYMWYQEVGRFGAQEVYYEDEDEDYWEDENE